MIYVARSWLFPVESPDLCYIHNLVTAAQLVFLRELYPEARLCMYFHGGEVGGNRKVEDEAAAVVDRLNGCARLLVTRILEAQEIPP